MLHLLHYTSALSLQFKYIIKSKFKFYKSFRDIDSKTNLMIVYIVANSLLIIAWLISTLATKDILDDFHLKDDLEDEYPNIKFDRFKAGDEVETGIVIE